MKTANDSTLSHELAAAPGLVLVDFHAPWCGPCKAMAPALEAFALENTSVTVIKVDVDESPDSAIAFKIRSVPTLAVFKNSKVVAQKTGALSKAQLEQLIQLAP